MGSRKFNSMNVMKVVCGDLNKLKDPGRGREGGEAEFEMWNVS